ncbi:MAG: transporter substrate-binding domain-containing protein [Oscillospiraceae bacterium]|nr:transporter substrate-binding domain-containing protein [Oscillospiraceae bacterium]
MKKVFAIIMAAVMLFALAACTAGNTDGGDTLAQIKSRGTITIATEGDWSPWTYHDTDTDELVGFDIELAKEIGKELGVTVEFKETDWDSILAGVDAGRFDIACNGVDWTAERAEKYHFSTPYVYMQEVIVTRKDNEDIHSMEDLKGKKTANSPNSTYADEAIAMGAEVTYVNTLAETIQVLEQGRVDATVNAKVSIEDYLREHPDANIKIVYESEGTSVCVPTQKNDEHKSLIDAVDAALQKMRDDGRLAALSEKYFGADLTRK